MTASLEPPSLRRRGDGSEGPQGPQGPREPSEPGDPEEPRGGRGRRGRHQLVALTVVVVLLGALVAIVLFTFHTFRAGSGQREDARLPPSQSPAPQLPPAEYDAVASAGRTALSTWARPRLAYRAWWKALTPLLSPAARTAYAETDPAQLPTLRLRRAVDVLPGPSPDTATVYLDTSAGRYGVDLTRQSARAPWRASRFLFPEQASSLS